MSDRGVFVAALMTAVLIVAGAFVLSQFFFFELAKSTIYIAIAVMVFFGEDRYSYMLGAVAPVLWIVVDIFAGVFFDDFRVLFDYLALKGTPALDTPLHATAHLMSVVLLYLSYRVWRKQVPEKFFGKTFGISVAIAIVYVGIVTVGYLHALPSGARMP